MSQTISKNPKYELESILLISSSFKATTPYNAEMKKYARVLISKDCGIDSSKDKLFYFTFPEISVEMIDGRKSSDKKYKKILTIKIEYFVGFKVLSIGKTIDRNIFFRDAALKTIWPFLTRDVVDYASKAGFAPIYLDVAEYT